MADTPDFVLGFDAERGTIDSVRLYGTELLEPGAPCASELWVNGAPLDLRPYAYEGPAPHDASPRVRGEQYVDHFSGWSLVLSRQLGERKGLAHGTYGLNYLIRREAVQPDTLPCPGPGGPAIEARLHADTFSLGCWNWRFWGEDTRMVFPSLHSNGPTDAFGHAGYEHDTPERVKAFLQNVWRRIYPGVMAIHGGLFYNARDATWLAVTCRRPHVGYILNIADAGRGVGYDFTLHASFDVNDQLRMPELRFHYGRTQEAMMDWLASYIGFFYEEPPAWVFRTAFLPGADWQKEATWTAQADLWERQLDEGLGSGVGYSLVTNRPVRSGTAPIGYEPDPNHGTQDEFRRMCRRLADRGVPLLIWMSHSGLVPGAQDVDDDWFIRGIDGRFCASWGHEDAPAPLVHCNPGHPGYIAYTKEWIRFYIEACGCKGIFLDCLGWAFPPDFRPRPFMRFPGDTNLMAVRFIEEVYACIKDCDPEAILLGEGATLEAPVNVVTLHANPVRAIDGMGPRDFLLHLGRYGTKRFCVHQGPTFFPAQGMGSVAPETDAALSKDLTAWLGRHGSPRALEPLPGDLSVAPDQRLLFVPLRREDDPPAFTLPEPYAGVTAIENTRTGDRFAPTANGAFQHVPAGMYRMESA